MLKYFLIGLIIGMGSFSLKAQENIPLGAWRDHIAYNKGKMIFKAGNQIYCIVDNGLFIYNLEEGGLQTVSKIEGLSDVTITAVEYINRFDLILLGYESGNIDLIQDNQIKNIDEIKNFQSSFSKRILDIETDKDFIFFITGSGVVVYDYSQQFFKETWQNLGITGDYLEIRQASILSDSIFLATEQGVIAGSLDTNVNLLDFRNWKRFDTDQGLPQVNTRHIEVYNDKLYCIQSDNSLYSYNNGEWTVINTGISDKALSLKASGGSLFITTPGQLFFMDQEESVSEISDPKLLAPREAIRHTNDIFVADNLNGLVRISNGSGEAISPNGPITDNVKELFHFEGQIIALPQAYNENFQPLRSEEGFSNFKMGSWINYNNTGALGAISLPEVRDLIDVTYNPSSGTVYFASFGYGLMSWDQGEIFNIFDENTPGSTLVNSNPPERNTFISSVFTDQQGLLWMTNYQSDRALHYLDSDETWEAFDLLNDKSRYLLKVIVLDNQDKWMIVSPLFGGGIIVYNEENNRYRLLTSEPDEGGLPDNRIYDIVVDREGMVWIGTNKGIVYFPFPFSVLEEEPVNALVPVFDESYLFRNEKITALEVDGGNRKWVGTEKGIWLLDEEGISLIDHFNQENSPLLSDKIRDIAINDNSGEVFMGTDKGVISYRGMATKPAPTHSKVKIFPNPVSPEFNGFVGIEGLPGSTELKITNVSGKLIFQTRSNGGTATWNVRDYNGKRVSTGIYLVFSSTLDGEDTFIGKIAVID